MLRRSSSTPAYLLLDLKGRDDVETYKFVVAMVCMIVYTIYAVHQISKFEEFWIGVFGTAAVIAGGIGIYLIIPIIAAVVLWIIRIIVIIGALALIGCIYDD